MRIAPTTKNAMLRWRLRYLEKRQKDKIHEEMRRIREEITAESSWIPRFSK
jgi:hypothetical protein